MPALKRKRPADDDAGEREHTTRLGSASGSRRAPVRRSTRRASAVPPPARRPRSLPEQAAAAPPGAAIAPPRPHGRPPRNAHAQTASPRAVIKKTEEDHTDNRHGDQDEDKDEDDGKREEDDQKAPGPLLPGKPRRLPRIPPGKENTPLQPARQPRLKLGRPPRQQVSSGSDEQHVGKRSSRVTARPEPSTSMPSPETTPATATDHRNLHLFAQSPQTEAQRTTIPAEAQDATSADSPPGRGGDTPEGMPGQLSDAAGSDRTIDTVALGDVCFRTWYTSFYGKDVLDEIAGNGAAKADKGAKHAGNHQINVVVNRAEGAKGEGGGAKTQGRRDRDHQPLLDRLYVCPCCFKYSKERSAWSEHVRFCEARRFVPGKKVYVHPKGRRCDDPRPNRSRADGNSRLWRRAGGPVKVSEDVFEYEGEWSVWEVDGEEEMLFCQNLSLFAKLFLDNKSVFFDVTGFNYFLLVYTPPAERAPRIVGFFSKEKISWDNNNLACILVFPPWQRKGLGALLMGVSYEISRREGVLGGPEKPISNLGKKGYKNYWAGEICRWLLGLDLERGRDRKAGGEDAATETDAEGEGGEGCEGSEEGGNGGNGGEQDGLVISIDACSRATWISPEDCLPVLRELAVVEESPGPDGHTEHEEDDADDQGGGGRETDEETEEGEGGEQEQDGPEKDARHIRISKQGVRAWVQANRISMEKACDPDGFVEGHAMRDRSAGEEDF